jgi:prevent-host-death family protein
LAVRKSMPVTISATDVHRKFGDLVRRVFSGREHFIVEKEGLPVVAILSIPEYQELMREREQNQQDKERRLKQFEEAAKAIGEEIDKEGLSEEEVMEKVDQVRQRIHDEHYGRHHRTDEKTPRPD